MALQQELTDLSREHDAEATNHSKVISQYEARIQALQLVATRSNATAKTQPDFLQNLTQELDETRRRVAYLSEELLRQQNLAETSKSEVLALKGRLQVATARAEAAEQRTAAEDVEVGRRQHRRRRGGGARYGHLTTRPMRTALGLAAPRNQRQTTLATTMDSFDTWLMETENILRHEPLARVGLVLYATLLHVWCFGLVIFHTIESEHGDVGQLADHSRLPHLQHN